MPIVGDEFSICLIEKSKKPDLLIINYGDIITSKSPTQQNNSIPDVIVNQAKSKYDGGDEKGF